MKLKNVRLMAGKTQTEVAKALNINQNTYSNYETEKTDPDIETLIKLAQYFHTTIDSLIGYNVPYLLDKSILDPECQQLIDRITTLSKRQCELVDTYITGLLTAEQEKQNLITKIKG